MAGNLSRPLTLRQEWQLEAIRPAGVGGLTTRELTHLHVYVNEAATRQAVRRLETRGLVGASPLLARPSDPSQLSVNAGVGSRPRR